MLLMDVTYRCKERDEETGRWVEGENACHLWMKKNQVEVQPNGHVVLWNETWTWMEEAIAALERLQGRKFIPGSICDIRLAKKEG